MEKLRISESEGFRMLDGCEFDLVASESKSRVKVKISRVQWIPTGEVTHEDLETQVSRMSTQYTSSHAIRVDIVCHSGETVTNNNESAVWTPLDSLHNDL